MKPYHQFKSFQIRWKEAMGSDPLNPYLCRWTLVLFGYSFRLHHWMGSDEKRYFHDHPWDFTSILLKGKYANVTPKGRVEVEAPFHWSSKATDKHYLDIPPKGAWTILICGRPYHPWGFYVNGKKWRPLRFFHKFGGEKANQNPIKNVAVV